VGITNVCVLEKGYLAGGNTARNTAVIRSNYITTESVRFYKESLDLFRNLSNDLGYNILYSQRGQITLAHTDAAVRTFRLRAEVGKHVGTGIEMVDRKQIREIVPSLNMDDHMRFPILAALWHPDGATGRHDAVAWGYAARAVEMGVEFHQRTEVTGLKVENGRIAGVETNRGTVTGGHVIQAVAGMSSVVAKMAGIQLPIRSFPLQAMVTQPVKPFLDPLVSSSALHCYVSQSGRGELVIGGGSDPYELYSTRSTLELKEGLIAHAVEMFPFIANLRLMRQWAGITDMTPDYSPIMGESPVRNYWLDAGWGTWGFKATPVCGKRMAQTVAQEKVPDLIAPFRLDRFKTFDLVNEMGATAASH
jgi:sarcosine oxidase subunit beta